MFIIPDDQQIIENGEDAIRALSSDKKIQVNVRATNISCKKRANNPQMCFCNQNYMFNVVQVIKIFELIDLYLTTSSRLM